ncbi:MAG: porin family protein [Burkholderiales bacterium]|nr:porin family protein [Burkholderiales bacterium]
MTSTRILRLAATPVIAACAVLAAGAHAQTTTTTTRTTTGSYMPWSAGSGGYIGLNLGRSEYNVDSGTPGLTFDNKGDFGKLTLGSLVNQNLGYEISYMHNGDITRGGGETKAQGLNFSVVGRIPLAEQFSLFGKLGATYGRTRTDAIVGSGISSGKDSGWGVGYGVGASWDFAPQWSLVAEWERHDYHFVGSKDGVDAASIGVRYRF